MVTERPRPSEQRRGGSCYMIPELHVHLPRQCEQSHAEVGVFLEPTLRHHRQFGASCGGVDEVADWAKAVFECFNALRAKPADYAAMQELDQIHSAFDHHIGYRA